MTARGLSQLCQPTLGFNGVTGDWGMASDWLGGVVPDGTGNATIGGNATETVTVSANEAVNVLTLDDANATLVVKATLVWTRGEAMPLDLLQGRLR